LSEQWFRFCKLALPAFFLLGILLAAASCSALPSVDTNPMNYDPQVREAFQHFYDLDFPGTVSRFERFQAQHPGDPQATAYVLEAVIFQELYEQDLLDTTFYANDGFLTGKHATREDPQVREHIMNLANEAISEADWRINHNPNDVDALYARSWVRALECTYLAMVDREFGAGFKLATKAREDASHALQIDPNYVDAKLVVGIYEYVVGALPWPFKFLVGFAGITGSKTTGMAMLHDAANRGVSTSAEARTAMALFLRRESRYPEAIQQIRSLENQYPHDFLFRLEEANLRKDAGEGMAAVSAYRTLLADADKPGYFPDAKLELAYFGFGDGLRGQRHYDEAAQAYEKAASARNVGPELKIRSLLAAGECRDLNGERQPAIRDYQAAIDAGPNTSRADTARKHLRAPYTSN
jgi:tetratricopeptide (TPR) repeat protein